MSSFLLEELSSLKLMGYFGHPLGMAHFLLILIHGEWSEMSMWSQRLPILVIMSSHGEQPSFSIHELAPAINPPVPQPRILLVCKLEELAQNLSGVTCNGMFCDLCHQLRRDKVVGEAGLLCLSQGAVSREGGAWVTCSIQICGYILSGVCPPAVAQR